MPGGASGRFFSLRERSLPDRGGEEKISKWLLLSLVVHGVLIASMFIIPFLPSDKSSGPPVYTVDLVGGERIGGRNLGTEIGPAARPAPKKTAEEAPIAVPEKAKVELKKPKTEKAEKTEKKKPVEKPAAVEERIPTKEGSKKEPVKAASENATKAETKAEKGLSESTREKLIQAALERVRNRADSAQKTAPGTSQSDPISSGAGEGEGAAVLGPGGRGGGIAKGIEFIAYQNRMLSTIKQNWAWVGQKSDMKVVVRFNIKDNGEIAALKIVQRSGDVSFDESVLRAVRKSNPLPSPPESLRKEFSDVELTFRPKDLGG